MLISQLHGDGAENEGSQGHVTTFCLTPDPSRFCVGRRVDDAFETISMMKVVLFFFHTKEEKSACHVHVFM